MGKTRHDWLSIKSEYTNAVPAVSQADLCKKYGINPVTMCRKAKKENWEFQRDRFQTRLSEQKAEVKAVAVADEGKVFDSDSLRFAKKGLAIADKLLDDKSLDPRVVKDVLAAGRTAQQIAKDAMGDKPDATVTVEGKVSLSLEQVIQEYADAIGAVPEANRS